MCKLGVLPAGPVFIGAVGEFVMRSARSGSCDSKGFILAGLGLFMMGHVRAFFGRLIRRGVA